MLKKFYLWLREKIAGDELDELATLKKRLSEMKSYMRCEPKIVEAVDWIAGENLSSIQGFRDNFRFRHMTRPNPTPYYREQLLRSGPKYYGTHDASELRPPTRGVDNEPSPPNVILFPRNKDE